MKKELIGIIICMLLVGTVLPVTGNVIVDKSPLSLDNGNTLYVGGDGEGNYTKIQYAIADSIDGDTIFVYDDSSPYYENLYITRSIKLIGENRNTTVIDGMKKGSTVTIIADNVEISGFIIQNADNDGLDYTAGISIFSDNNVIKDNIIRNNRRVGIYSDWDSYSNGNIIMNNIITNNTCDAGIAICGNNNNISYNNMSNNKAIGIYFGEGNYNEIYHNIIIRNHWGGILIWLTYGLLISRNVISLNEFGIKLCAASNTKIINNNFIKNKYRNAKFLYPILLMMRYFILYNKKPIEKNIWDNNYWDHSRNFYIVLGLISFTQLSGLVADNFSGFNFCEFDWHPAKEPYDIGI